MQALALTDHHGLAGAVEFYEACLGFEVQPILGLEIDVIASPAPVSRLVLLASDLEGWGSLCRLSSINLTPVRDKGKTSTFVVDFGGEAAEINNKKPLSRTHVDLGDAQGLDEPLPFERFTQDVGGLICLTGGRRCWLGLRMARIAGEAPCLMAVRRKAALFLDGGQSGPEHCYNCSQTKYPFKQAYLFLSHSIRDYTTVFQSRISNLELF